jgi:hypothetical protein
VRSSSDSEAKAARTRSVLATEQTGFVNVDLADFSHVLVSSMATRN